VPEDRSEKVRGRVGSTTKRLELFRVDSGQKRQLGCNAFSEDQGLLSKKGAEMDVVAEMNRLRWRCTHRAMLEMDLLLGEFLEKRFSNLSPEQAAAFVALAEMEDQDLWPLVVGKRACKDSMQAEIVSMLRSVKAK
jgi:antitoxin CptB